MMIKASTLKKVLSRARRNGFQPMRLPLERHLAWKSGATKSMPFNHIFAILARFATRSH